MNKKDKTKLRNNTYSPPDTPRERCSICGHFRWNWHDEPICCLSGEAWDVDEDGCCGLFVEETQ